MKIKAVVENQDGTFEFTANLTPEQHQFLIEYAVQDLLRKGLFIPEVDDNNVQPTVLAS